MTRISLKIQSVVRKKKYETLVRTLLRLQKQQQQQQQRQVVAASKRAMAFGEGK